VVVAAAAVAAVVSDLLREVMVSFYVCCLDLDCYNWSVSLCK
jgi:hypothetical protein